MRVEALGVLLLTAGLAGCMGDTGSQQVDPTATNNTADPSSREPDPKEGADENETSSRSSNGTSASNSSSSGPEPGTVIAEGRIHAGSWTSSNFFSTAALTECQVEEVESFCFHDPPANATVETRTNTSSPQFNVDIWFHTDEGEFLGGCDEGRSSPAGGAGDETNCTVPPEADRGTVDATFGLDLSVKLVVAETGS